MGIHLPLLMDAFSSKHIFVHIVGSKAVIQKLSLSTINVVVDFRISENCLLEHFFLHHFIKLICSQVFWCSLYTHRVVFVVIGIVCYIMNIIRNGKTQSESPAERNSAV